LEFGNISANFIAPASMIWLHVSQSLVSLELGKAAARAIPPESVIWLLLSPSLVSWELGKDKASITAKIKVSQIGTRQHFRQFYRSSIIDYESKFRQIGIRQHVPYHSKQVRYNSVFSW
jgi:hypothetical protein